MFTNQISGPKGEEPKSSPKALTPLNLIGDQQLAAPFNKVFQRIQHFASKMLDKAGQQHARVAVLKKVFRALARVVIPKLNKHDEVKKFRNETRIWAFTCKY